MASGLGNDEYYYVDAAGDTEQLRLAETVKDEAGQIRATRYITVPKLENQEPKQGGEFFVGSPQAYDESAN